ncbi:MAG TPA: hypothetical protein PLD03_10255 [Thiomonas arsenitoxydans]|nr:MULTISPECIES: hypothetical protein [unclassified Thiomonas]HOI66975.1 hypothetical protein [Thiomonas arsenitoxydans]
MLQPIAAIGQFPIGTCGRAVYALPGIPRGDPHMLAIPTINIASGQPPSLASVRSACRKMKLCIAASYAVLAYFIARSLIALGQSHMRSTPAALGVGSLLAIVKDLGIIALLLGAAYALYRSLTIYQSLRLCDDSKICRVVYAVCRVNPAADRYRIAVLRSGRGFLTAEIDGFFRLCPPELWTQSWPQDLKARIQSPEPLAVMAKLTAE